MLVKQIYLENRLLEYKIKYHARAQRVRISINTRGVVVTLPTIAKEAIAEDFLKKQALWVWHHIDKNKDKKDRQVFTAEHYKKHKGEALNMIVKKVEEWNKVYNFNYNKIYIRNQKTRWGSCSSNKNLNFNYKLFFLPVELVDYVVVHELCHLKHMNHSTSFWSEVGKGIANYKDCRRVLKKHEASIF